MSDMSRYWNEDYIAHFGVSKLNGAKIGSGRYPLGSGKRPRAITDRHPDGKDIDSTKTKDKQYDQGHFKIKDPVKKAEVSNFLKPKEQERIQFAHISNEMRKKIKEGSDYILPKRAEVDRVSTSKSDPTYSNRKYVSVMKEDQDKWDRHLGTAYADFYNMKTYHVRYTMKKPLKIAGVKTMNVVAGELLFDGKGGINKKAIRQLHDDQLKCQRSHPGDYTCSADYAGECIHDHRYDKIYANQMFLGTTSAKAFQKQLKRDGYDGMYDVNGLDVSEVPTIIFNPDRNLKKYGDTTYTTAVNNFLKEKAKKESK